MLKLKVQNIEQVATKRFNFQIFGNRLSNAIAEDFKKFVQDSIFNNRFFAVITGQTKQAVKFAKVSNGRFVVRPGIGVPGMQNYLNLWEKRMRPGMRAFMKPSQREYRNSPRRKQIEALILQKSLEKAVR